jgi:uroporphyrinogen decarboxylase
MARLAPANGSVGMAGASGAICDITDYYQIDIAICVADESPFPSMVKVLKETPSEKVARDGYGRVVRTVPGGYFFEVLENIKITPQSLDNLPLDPPQADSRYSSYVKQVQSLSKKRCVFAKVGGPFLRTASVRNETEFLMDIAADPEFAHALASRMADFLTEIGLESLRRGNLWDTGIWIFDDMAYNDNPMFSPKQFERIFLPCYKRMVTAFKGAGARKVILHCDGNLAPLLDMLIDAGIDGINPVEPKAHLDLYSLKERYRNRLAYIGGMCNAHVLPRGTRREIRAQVERIKEAARGGGVIIGAHSIGDDIPVENYDYYHSLVMQPL